MQNVSLFRLCIATWFLRSQSYTPNTIQQKARLSGLERAIAGIGGKPEAILPPFDARGNLSFLEGDTRQLALSEALEKALVAFQFSTDRISLLDATILTSTGATATLGANERYWDDMNVVAEILSELSMLTIRQAPDGGTLSLFPEALQGTDRAVYETYFKDSNYFARP